MFSYCNNGPVINRDSSGDFSTSCLMASDSGYNPYARATLINKQLSGISYDVQNFSNPAIMASVSAENVGLAGSFEFSSSHGVVTDGKSVTITTDTAVATVGASVGIHKVSIECGAYLLKDSITIKTLLPFEISLGYSIGIGGEGEVGENGIKFGATYGFGLSFAVLWESVSPKPAYINKTRQ